MLNLSNEILEKHKAGHTVGEIAQQPVVWKEVYDNISSQKEKVIEFFKNISKNDRIIFTGAGSSGYIGDSLAPQIRKLDYNNVESVHTTDIVSCPEQYLIKDVPTILISFGRSGNSPESVAAIALANLFVTNIKHIVITCNSKGELAQIVGENVLNFTFDRLGDLGFAMTSSQTGMMLSAYTIFNINNNIDKNIEKICAAGLKALNEDCQELHNIAQLDYTRLIVLGSGNLNGVAKESALKSMELSAGNVMGWYDSPMGFRHGPKSLLNSKTIILFFLSEDANTKQYEYDMLKELSNSTKQCLIVVSGKYDKTASEYADKYFYSSKEDVVPQQYLPYYCTIVAQIIATYHSISLGLFVDNPFPDGEVNRVVAGVTIHPYK